MGIVGRAILPNRVAVDGGAGGTFVLAAYAHVAPVLEQHTGCAELRELGDRKYLVVGYAVLDALVPPRQAAQRVRASARAYALVLVVQKLAVRLAEKSYV